MSVARIIVIVYGLDPCLNATQQYLFLLFKILVLNNFFFLMINQLSDNHSRLILLFRVTEVIVSGLELF